MLGTMAVYKPTYEDISTAADVLLDVGLSLVEMLTKNIVIQRLLAPTRRLLPQLCHSADF